MANKPRFRQRSMKDLMRQAEQGRDTVYETYRFGDGHSELYKDRVGGVGPRFVKRS